MEPTSEARCTPKRHRLPSDNQSCDSLSDSEQPQQKKMACPTKSKQANSPAPDSKNTRQGTINKDTNHQSANNNTTSQQLNSTIGFNVDFDDFNVEDTAERNKLTADFKKVMTQFQRGDSEIEGVQEIQKTLKDIQPLNDVVYLYVRFAGQQPTSNFNTDSLCSLLCVAKQFDVKPYIF